MYVGIEYKWKKVVGNAYLMFYVFTKITMIPNKNVEKIKEKLAVITEKIQRLTIELRWVKISTQWKRYQKIKSELEDLKLERNHLINLINIIDG